MSEPKQVGAIVTAGDGSLVYRRFDGMAGIPWLQLGAAKTSWHSWAEIEAHGNVIEWKATPCEHYSAGTPDTIKSCACGRP